MDSYSELKRDLWFGILSLCFTVFFGISTVYTIQTEGETGITSRTFPFIITALLAVLSSLLIYNTLKELKNTPEKDKIYEDLLSRPELRRITIFVVSIVLYVFSFIYIGFVVSTVLYLAFLMWFMHAKNIWISGAIVIIAPGLLWYFFTKLMEVTFPEALLF